MINAISGQLCNALLTLLRNKKQLTLTREQIRSCNISFSQFGEDLLILSHFPKGYTGRYVDVGAFHPYKLSNTMLLYKLGWSGLNIDCDQDKILQFQTMRPRDKSVCAAVSGVSKEMTLLRYPLAATNRLLESFSCNEDSQASLCGESPKEILKVTTKTLDQILNDQGIANKQIDYLNIDVEGMELEVLRGANLTQIKPSLISLEIMNEQSREEISLFMHEQGFYLTDIVRHNYFFRTKSL
jgi:FkbM family methyltransferase